MNYRPVVACNILALGAAVAFAVGAFLIASKAAPVAFRPTIAPMALPPIEREPDAYVLPDDEMPRFECMWFQHCDIWA